MLIGLCDCHSPGDEYLAQGLVQPLVDCEWGISLPSQCRAGSDAMASSSKPDEQSEGEGSEGEGEKEKKSLVLFAVLQDRRKRLHPRRVRKWRRKRKKRSERGLRGPRVLAGAGGLD